MKKKIMIGILLFLIFCLMIPRKEEKNGFIFYKTIFYKVTKVHAFNYRSETGYTDGVKIELFGQEIYSKMNEHDEIYHHDTLSFTLKENTLTETGGIFLLKNNSAQSYYYGAEYLIEQWEDSSWQEVETLSGTPLVWNAQVFELKGWDEIEIDLDWQLGYGSLREGIYRIQKNVTLQNEAKDRITLYEFFVIQ